MPVLDVHIKHSGATHDLKLDTDAPPAAFKDAIYAATGVPTDRMKVMIKGKLLKDDANWSALSPQAGQTFMVIGSAGPLPKAPEKPIVFFEDMDVEESAVALNLPVGLKNMGNTCYMNATVQAMRAIPELQEALTTYTPSGGDNAQQGVGSSVLSVAMKNMYAQMRTSVSSYDPSPFLSVLRQVAPQFAEMSRGGKGHFAMAGYAQQDAEECWTQISNSLRAIPGVPGPSGGTPKKLIEQFMMAQMQRTLTRTDPGDPEEPTITYEDVFKVECNITNTTNYMHTAVLNAMTQMIEKRSPVLGREAEYEQKSRLSRIPANLMVHMVRFAWKREINKKAKIMRKVKFPTEMDVLDLCTPELAEKIRPVNRKMKSIALDRNDRLKILRARGVTVPAATTSTPAIAATGSEPAPAPAPAEGDGTTPMETDKTEELPEVERREKEKLELETLVPEDIKNDVGSSPSGLYDLVAIVTHKGAEADAGHYMGFVKKSVFHPQTVFTDDEYAKRKVEGWYKFDDEVVSEFPEDKLGTIDGGGEDSAAYVLLYRTRSFT